MGKYLNMLGDGGKSEGVSDQKKQRVQERGPVELRPLVPGVLITWPGKEEPAVLDCLHTEPDGSVWAFVALPDGWAAVNAKYVTAVGTL